MKFASSPRLTIVCIALLCGCSGGSMPEGDPQKPEDDLAGPDNPDGEPTCRPSVPYKPRLARLTHRQYANTLATLLGESVDVAAVLSPDPAPFRFDNDTGLLRVSQPLARDYRRVAEDVGSSLAKDGARTKQLTGCATEDAGCATRFIETFGAKAFRRPLASEEKAAFAKLYEAGHKLGGFGTGVAWTVEAMLQTPQLLYRVSLDDQPGPEGLNTPNAWELASQLSYTLWNTMPDDELFALAAESKLLSRSELLAQVRRMLDDPRARDMVSDFHNQFMDAKKFLNLQRDAKAFPNFATALGGAMQKEVELFSAAAVLEDDLPFEALLKAPFTYADASLAKLYGVAAPNNPDAKGFARVTLDPNKRGGLLTQLGFLTSHAHQDASAPILRGTFVLKNVLCMETPPPPPEVDLTLPMPDPGMTTRELVTKITSGSACKTCHHIINPVGFAFENFDPVGQWRNTDAGKPVDATGSLDLGAGTVQFDGPMALVGHVAASAEAATCYAESWLSFVLARQLAEPEHCLSDGLGLKVRKQDFTIKDLIAEAVTSRSFLYRNTDVSEGAKP